MSLIDDKLNSLSADELDVLNSDPKMLEDFKNKYSQPEVMGAVGDQLKSSLLPNPTTANQPFSGKPEEILQQSLSPAEGLSRLGATLQVPSEMAGNAVEEFGKDINAPLTGKLGGFITKTALDPMTWPMMGSNVLSKEAESQIPKLLERAANIPEKATLLEGAKLPTPSTEEIEQSVKKVQDVVKEVWKEHGDLLNKAKAASGIPATEDDVATSVRRYGNASNLNIGRPLELPDNLKMARPQMEEDIAGATTKDVNTGDVKAYLKGTQKGGINPNTGQPIADVPIYGVKGDPEKIKAMFGSSDVASVPENVLKEKGIELPKETPKVMPYQIGEHDDPRQLMTEINRFKANTAYISKADQVKAAHYFQDQIVQQGIFKQDTAKGIVNGTLKGQYGDLANIINESSPELKAAKSKMADLYDTMDEISKKLSGAPGDAEAYLRKLFTSKSASAKDDLRALAKIEQLSGKPMLQELFKKFAGEAYGQTLGESVHTIFQAPYALITSPKYAITPIIKYGPKAATAAKFIGAGSLEDFALRQHSPEAYSELQSVRDRMQNNAQ